MLLHYSQSTKIMEAVDITEDIISVAAGVVVIWHTNVDSFNVWPPRHLLKDTRQTTQEEHSVVQQYVEQQTQTHLTGQVSTCKSA